MQPGEQDRKNDQPAFYNSAPKHKQCLQIWAMKEYPKWTIRFNHQQMCRALEVIHLNSAAFN